MHKWGWGQGNNETAGMQAPEHIGARQPITA
jgi:hypothetical protein